MCEVIRRCPRRVATLVLACVLASSTMLAACGGGGSSTTTSSRTTNSSDSAIMEGGAITTSQSAQPDFLDPALGFSQASWEPLSNVYVPLLTYPHKPAPEGSRLIPGLASALPEVSTDGKTYTLTLRPGMKYSNGAPVKASDFKHAIKRVLYLGSAGASFYEAIVGADAYLKAHKTAADIPGIVTDDQTGKITIRLTEADSSFANILAFFFAAPVPGDTPFKNMTSSPPPGVGPYVITESVPNRQYVLEKSKTFAGLRIPDLPVGHVDKITTKIISNPELAAQNVLNNKIDYTPDPPPADLRPQILRDARDRYVAHTYPQTTYIFMNLRVAPFDKPLVRQAVNYGIDRSGLARLFGGLLVPGCGFTNPGIVGSDKTFDTTGCPYGDPSKPPNLTKARALIKQAGAQRAKVTVWASAADPFGKAADAYASMLDEIGLDATPKPINDAVYGATVGNQKTRAQTGIKTWGSDYPNPLETFSFLVDGRAIQPTNNLNVGNIDDPHVNKEIARLKGVADLESVAGDWRALDQYVVAPPQSYFAVIGHKQNTTFMSARMDMDSAVFSPVWNNDYASFAIKKTG